MSLTVSLGVGVVKMLSGIDVSSGWACLHSSLMALSAHPFPMSVDLSFSDMSNSHTQPGGHPSSCSLSCALGNLIVESVRFWMVVALCVLSGSSMLPEVLRSVLSLRAWIVLLMWLGVQWDGYMILCGWY